MPNKENEVGFTPAMYPGLPPCPNHTCTNGQRALYSEGLQVGYRWYHAQNVSAAFAFGHGLSYTEFDYSFGGVAPSKDRLVVVIANTGGTAGAEVAQLYISFPDEEGEPPRQLKVSGPLRVAQFVQIVALVCSLCLLCFYTRGLRSLCYNQTPTRPLHLTSVHRIGVCGTRYTTSGAK
jgi:hypothetical protein